MTITELHKLTGKLIAKGQGRHQVCIHKPSFSHPLESDGVEFILVESGKMDTHVMLDDDGGIATLADGREKTRTTLVLEG